MPARTRSSPRISSVTARMAALLSELAHGEGFLPSALPGVRFMRSTLHVPRTPVAYDPGILIVAQGRKWGHLGDRRFVYDASHYLVLTVPLPFECETLGTPAEPLLGLCVGLQPTIVAELAIQLPLPLPISEAKLRSVDCADLDDALAGTALRLLESLRTPDEAQILGPQLVREITYRVMVGKLGANVRALASPTSHFSQISRVLNRLHTDYAGEHDIETLARGAGMSVSAFHSHFKAVTASSPLQYLKTIRLHKARMLMLNDGASAAEAAGRVGYESASQFSREYKRLFGASPAASVAQLRTNSISFA